MTKLDERVTEIYPMVPIRGRGGLSLHDGPLRHRAPVLGVGSGESFGVRQEDLSGHPD